MMRISNQAGHGDLYVRRVSEADVPAEVRRRLKAGRARRVTLALGEATGHAHVLSSEAAIGYERISDVVAYVLLRQAGLLDHTGTVEGEGHGTRLLEPGWYEVPTERDYDPTLYARRVVD